MSTHHVTCGCGATLKTDVGWMATKFIDAHKDHVTRTYPPIHDKPRPWDPNWPYRVTFGDSSGQLSSHS